MELWNRHTTPVRCCLRQRTRRSHMHAGDDRRPRCSNLQQNQRVFVRTREQRYGHIPQVNAYALNRNLRDSFADVWDSLPCNSSRPEAFYAFSPLFCKAKRVPSRDASYPLRVSRRCCGSGVPRSDVENSTPTSRVRIFTTSSHVTVFITLFLFHFYFILFFISIFFVYFPISLYARCILSIFSNDLKKSILLKIKQHRLSQHIKMNFKPATNRH